MSHLLPPPPERFDPITERWVTPGGPLPDPERDFFDPNHRESVELVGPIPPELAGSELGAGAGDDAPDSPSARLRRFLLIVLALAAGVALVVLVMTA